MHPATCRALTGATTVLALAAAGAAWAASTPAAPETRSETKAEADPAALKARYLACEDAASERAALDSATAGHADLHAWRRAARPAPVSAPDTPLAETPAAPQR